MPERYQLPPRWCTIRCCQSSSVCVCLSAIQCSPGWTIWQTDTNFGMGVHFMISRPSPMVKVIGQRSRSLGQKCDFCQYNFGGFFFAQSLPLENYVSARTRAKFAQSRNVILACGGNRTRSLALCVSIHWGRRSFWAKGLYIIGRRRCINAQAFHSYVPSYQQHLMPLGHTLHVRIYIVACHLSKGS